MRVSSSFPIILQGDNPTKLSGDPKSVKGFGNLVSYRKVDKLMNVHAKQPLCNDYR